MEIGGYFELELKRGKEFHKDAIKLNSGRNAFEYILRAREYKKVFLPFFTCSSMLQPIKRLGLSYEFFHIDKNFEPVFDFSQLTEDEAFVYTNYFGLCDEQAKKISNVCKNLIIDNAQAFFSRPLPEVDTFYSPRKFFGVPDGAYLFTAKELKVNLTKDSSLNRFAHLIGRIDKSANSFFAEFKRNNELMDNEPIKKMSNITQKILASIDYNYVKTKRRQNFNILHKTLQSINQLCFQLSSDLSPMVYPLIINRNDLRDYLIRNKIYVAQYWPNVLEWTKESDPENKLTRNLIPLPIDQRYDEKEMGLILRIIQKWK